MATARIKEEYKTAVVAFGTSGLPLGQRDDIDKLAIIALESSDPTLLKMFEYLPSLEDLKMGKVEDELKVLMPERIPITIEKETTNAGKGNDTNKNKRSA